MRKLACSGAVVALLAAAPLAAQNPAALMLQMQGGVSVKHAGATATSAVVGERMFAGDEVIPDPGGRAILITRTGARQVVTASTRIQEAAGAGSSAMFDRVMSTLAQAASTDATMGGRQGMIRPIPGTTTLVAPLNKLTVSSTHPTFTWTSTAGAHYELMLRDVAGGTPQIFDVGTDTTWTLPSEAPGLTKGSVYSWTIFVGGRQSGRPLPQQEFKVIGLEEGAELETLIEEISVFGLDPKGDGLFLTAVVYRDLGLFYDALGALDTIAMQSTMGADLYMLKGEVLANLGWERQAREAFNMADELMR